MNADELLELVRGGSLDEHAALDALRNPYCTAEIAAAIADSPRLLTSHVVRERLSGFRHLPFARVMDLMATLPWTSLLAIAQSPRTAPVVRRHAEKKLLNQIPHMSLGEKIALARRVHRALLRQLIAVADGKVLAALLNNPRFAENDILVILNTAAAPPEFFSELARHSKWGHSYGVRRALAECARTPLPLALAALVQLRATDLRDIAERPSLREQVRHAARALKEKEDKGLRRVIRSEGNDVEERPADPSDRVR